MQIYFLLTSVLFVPLGPITINQALFPPNDSFVPRCRIMLLFPLITNKIFVEQYFFLFNQLEFVYLFFPKLLEDRIPIRFFLDIVPLKPVGLAESLDLFHHILKSLSALEENAKWAHQENTTRNTHLRLSRRIFDQKFKNSRS
jgi:hypothetical protein